MNLAEAIVKVVGDFTGFRQQIAAEGDRAGQTLGQRMRPGLTRALGAGIALGGAALGAAAAVGTRGVVDLDNAMADYQATTGATVEETERAAETTERLFRGNLGVDSYEDVARAQAALRTNLQLTEDQIDDSIESYVDFARVTGQDTVGAIEGMDNVLDTWGLSTDDAASLMDRLLVSNQEYGGSVEENIGTLGALAPAMQAANFSVDDAIGLLNLFGAKGLDGSRASAAFARALNQVESPEELQNLITDISETEDPFERAQKAADLFGARAGAQLANALGDANLDEYAVGADEAAGATERAAEQLDSSFGRQAQLWIRNIQGMAVDMVQGLGPGIGGIAMAASAAGPAFGGLFSMLKGGATGAIPMLLGAVGKIGPLLTGLATGPVGIIIAAVAALFVAWQTNFLGIRDIVGNVVGWLGDVALPWIGGIFDGVVDVVSNAVGLVTGIIEGIVGVVSTVWGAVEDLFGFITGGTEKARFEMGEVGKAATSSIPTGNLGSLPKYAEGTPYVPEDQLAYLHRGEAVLDPETAQAWRYGMGGGGDTINVYVQGLVNARTTQEIASGLLELERHGRLGPRRRRFANA